MADYILKIITDLDKLSERSEEINPFTEENKVKKIVNDLKDTLIANKDVVALSASQIGSPYRIFCLKFSDNELRAFVNPMITKSEGMHLCREVNASLPNSEYIMPRSDKIILRFQTPTGVITENIFEGVVAEVVQQQMQLLDGILISDIGLPILEGFDEATEEEKQQIIDMWLDNLKKHNNDLNKEIDSNEDMLKVKKAIEFMTKVANGEVTIEKVETDKDGSSI